MVSFAAGVSCAAGLSSSIEHPSAVGVATIETRRTQPRHPLRAIAGDPREHARRPSPTPNCHKCDTDLDGSARGCHRAPSGRSIRKFQRPFPFSTRGVRH
jgi:ribosomal protein L34E